MVIRQNVRLFKGSFRCKCKIGKYARKMKGTRKWKRILLSSSTDPLLWKVSYCHVQIEVVKQNIYRAKHYARAATFHEMFLVGKISNSLPMMRAKVDRSFTVYLVRFFFCSYYYFCNIRGCVAGGRGGGLA